MENVFIQIFDQSNTKNQVLRTQDIINSQYLKPKATPKTYFVTSNWIFEAISKVIENDWKMFRDTF